MIDSSLDRILRGVSRSIFLTLKVAPRSTRRQLGIAYLFCRAADTIADTRLCSRTARRDSLDLLRQQFLSGTSPEDLARLAVELGPPQSIPEEHELLERLPLCFEALATLSSDDQARIARLVLTLTQGMQVDLDRFPAEESGEVVALETDADLDQYTYYVAGCVGEFWTELQVAHIKALRHWDLTEMKEQGVRFGKGLQLTNILRDVRGDLRIGRCYLPRAALAAEGLEAGDLRDDRQLARLRPILAAYLVRTMEHYDVGWRYTLAIPRSVPRLRLACAWPLLLGLRTLRLLACSDEPYATGTHHKISRKEVYSIMRRSAARVFSNRALDGLYREFSSGLPRS